MAMYYKKKFKKQKKNGEKKSRSDTFSFQINTFAGMHVYRSANKDAPFSEWTRLTEKPHRSGKFTDNYEKDDDLTYFYKTTEVDIYGNESAPKEPEKMFWLKDGKKIERKPETTIMGINCYWSEDPDLPLEQWKKLNEELILGKLDFASPIKTPFYIFGIYVNELGNEFGQPSEKQRIVPIE